MKKKLHKVEKGLGVANSIHVSFGERFSRNER
jgi:hypothetical protein